MSVARECFDRQMMRLSQSIARAQTAIDDAGNAKKLILGLEDFLRSTDEIYALRLCERVLDKLSGETFERAFTTIYENAKRRLIQDDYSTHNTSPSARFLGDSERRGDSYFVDRFEIVALGLAEESGANGTA